MDCLKCGAQMERKTAVVPGKYGKETFCVKTSAMRCPACRYVTVAAPDLDAYYRTVADAYRTARRRLTSAEIVAARRRMRMSQRQFAAYLGVGEASVKRWELGQVQDKAMDELIRLKTEPAYAAKNHSELLSRLSQPR